MGVLSYTVFGCLCVLYVVRALSDFSFAFTGLPFGQLSQLVCCVRVLCQTSALPLLACLSASSVTEWWVLTPLLAC